MDDVTGDRPFHVFRMTVTKCLAVATNYEWRDPSKSMILVPVGSRETGIPCLVWSFGEEEMA
jgi:hypothetical protein